MASYKVIQDIEAEDKILGPLSLRQFIYAGVTIALGFIAFRLFIAQIWYIAIIFLPPMLFFGLLAAPLGAQQSSEIWLLAKIKFFVFPKKRIWSQDGIQELVTITVPKKIEKQLTKGYSESEEQSRLKALADTMDTRGWVIKNVATPFMSGSNDRLFDIDVANNIGDDGDDMFDSRANPQATRLEQMLQQNLQTKREDLLEKVNAPTITYPNSPAVNSPDVSNQIKKHASESGLATKNMNNILSQKKVTEAGPTKQPMTVAPNPDILKLVNNNDLSVATIAHEAGKQTQLPNDEVVISLH